MPTLVGNRYNARMSSGEEQAKPWSFTLTDTFIVMTGMCISIALVRLW